MSRPSRRRRRSTPGPHFDASRSRLSSPGDASLLPPLPRPIAQDSTALPLTWPPLELAPRHAAAALPRRSSRSTTRPALHVSSTTWTRRKATRCSASTSRRPAPKPSRPRGATAPNVANERRVMPSLPSPAAVPPSRATTTSRPSRAAARSHRFVRAPTASLSARRSVSPGSPSTSRAARADRARRGTHPCLESARRLIWPTRDERTRRDARRARGATPKAAGPPRCKRARRCRRSCRRRKADAR